jgi:hypothetical protein
MMIKWGFDKDGHNVSFQPSAFSNQPFEVQKAQNPISRSENGVLDLFMAPSASGV